MSRKVVTRLPAIVSLIVLCVSLSPGAWAHCAGNHQGNHPHCNGGGTSGGDEDPVFSAEGVIMDFSTDPPTEFSGLFAEVDSHSLDPGDVIVFRGVTVDLSAFDARSGCSHGVKTGTLSTRPKSSEDPDVAVVRFGFRSELLKPGQEAHHILVMEGSFVGNWPPLLNEVTSLEDFYYWNLEAEQKKAQRDDCAGNSLDNGLGIIADSVVTVTRVSNP